MRGAKNDQLAAELSEKRWKWDCSLVRYCPIYELPCSDRAR